MSFTTSVGSSCPKFFKLSRHATTSFWFFLSIRRAIALISFLPEPASWLGVGWGVLFFDPTCIIGITLPNFVANVLVFALLDALVGGGIFFVSLFCVVPVFLLLFEFEVGDAAIVNCTPLAVSGLLTSFHVGVLLTC